MGSNPIVGRPLRGIVKEFSGLCGVTAMQTPDRSGADNLYQVALLME